MFGETRTAALLGDKPVIGFEVSRSRGASEVEVGAGDRIVSLSTCSYDFENARYVLFGRLTALPQP